MSFWFWDYCFKISFTETEDFVNSAKQNPDVFLDHSTLLDIEQDTAMTNQGNVRLTFSVGKDQIEVKRCIKEINISITYLFSDTKVRVLAPPEHPFFVYGRSWSSVSPGASLARYGLTCCQLSRGDVCISLTQSEAQHWHLHVSLHCLTFSVSLSLIYSAKVQTWWSTKMWKQFKWLFVSLLWFLRASA